VWRGGQWAVLASIYGIGVGGGRGRNNSGETPHVT
jgi:hypothetical protein